MGLAYRVTAEMIKPIDILEVRQDSLKRLTTSPFGITPAQYETNPPKYLGMSAPWKGIKGGKGNGAEGFGRALLVKGALHGAISSENREKLVAGLRRAIEISKKNAGVFGTTIYNGKLYPAKCIKQKTNK